MTSGWEKFAEHGREILSPKLASCAAKAVSGLKPRRRKELVRRSFSGQRGLSRGDLRVQNCARYSRAQRAEYCQQWCLRKNEWGVLRIRSSVHARTRPSVRQYCTIIITLCFREVEASPARVTCRRHHSLRSRSRPCPEIVVLINDPDDPHAVESSRLNCARFL